MKKLLLAAAAIIVIIIAVVIVRKGNKPDVAYQPSPTTTPSSFTVVVLASDVSVKQANEMEFHTISDKAEVSAGTEIKTSVQGKAKLLYPNGTVTNIGQDSHIKIETLDAKGSRSRIRVVVGDIWSKVKSVLGADQYYEVETDNTVASVRGTIFWTRFRNHITRITGIENTIRVQARDPKLNKPVDGTDVDIKTGEETTISGDTNPAGKRLLKRLLSDADFRLQIRESIAENLDQEDLSNPQVLEIIRRVQEQNINDQTFIKRLIERRLLNQNGSPTPSRSPIITPRTSATPSPTVSASPTASPTARPTAEPTPVATPTPAATETPAPILKPIIDSLFPKSGAVSQEITINGRNFKNSRGDVSYIGQITMGGMPATKFNVLDSLTIFATPNASLAPGVYDVTVVSTSGDTSTLSQALTIQ